MFLYQYILLAGFACLLLNKKTRFAAATFLLGWAVYLLSTIGTGPTYYYATSAVLETAIAVTLNDRHRYIAYLGYSLILVNIYGLLSHIYPDGRNNYILIYAAVSITQFTLLLCRLLPNGIRRLFLQRFNICNHNYDCGETYAKVCKSSQTYKECK